MAIHRIVKQKLLGGPFSNDALRLAKAIYHTYINDEKNLFLHIHIQKVLFLLGLEHNENSLSYLRYLFAELNEPFAVRNFKFYDKVYSMRIIVFCNYTIKDEILELELSEEFMHMESEYMLDSFLSK
jgi:hypothetical protein